MPTYLDFEQNNKAVEGYTHQFQDSTLEADHPPLGDNSNKVATTKWVNSLLTNTLQYPIVTQASALSINVGEGYINDLSGNPVLIPASTVPISVVGGATDYIYIRYSDMKPIASTIIPDSSLGYPLARVISSYTQINEIIQMTPDATGWATLESPTFTGDPQVPNPPIGDYDNSIATTKWVKDELALLLGTNALKPNISTSLPSTLLWTSGVVNIDGLGYEVSEGSRVFGIGETGIFTVRGVLQVGNVAQVEVSNTIPVNPYIDLATVKVNAGLIEGFTLINTPLNPGDVSFNTVTTDYLTQMLLNVFHGMSVPVISISTDKALIKWSNGGIKIGNSDIVINSGEITTNSKTNGIYYLYGQSSSNTLFLEKVLPISSYRVLGKLEIYSNLIKGFYPTLPGFGS